MLRRSIVIPALFMLFAAGGFVACDSGSGSEGGNETSEFSLLVEYLEGDGGNYLNTSSPKVISAADVMADGLDAWTIIDIRGGDKYGPDGNGDFVMGANGTTDFEDGHIAGAVFVPLADVVTYADENLLPTDKILVVCYSGQTAGHAVLALNLLGYDAYALLFGMSGWNADMDVWSGKVGSDFAGQFVTDADPGKNAAGDFPTLDTGADTAEGILEARIETLLSGSPRFVSATDLMAAPDDYYIVNYWGEADYLDPGHIDGAHQYTPKASLSTDADLATLPIDKKIAVYCYTGQNGSQVAAWLTLLGYDAYDVLYGTNGMIFDQMSAHKWPGPGSFEYVTD